MKGKEGGKFSNGEKILEGKLVLKYERGMGKEILEGGERRVVDIEGEVGGGGKEKRMRER